MEKIRFNALLVFSLALPVNQKLSTLLIVLSALLAIIDYRSSINVFNKNFSKKYLPLVFLYLVFSISYFRDYFILDKNMFEPKATLLAFPLIFSTISINKHNIEQLLKSFVIGCVIGYFLLLFMAFYNSISFVDFTFNATQKEFVGSNVDVFQVNYFLGKLFVNEYHTTYLSVYFLLSMVIIFVLEEMFSKKIKFLFLGVFTIAIFQMFSLFSIIVWWLVVLYFANKYLKITLITATASLLLILFSFKGNSLNYSNLLSLRPTIWKTSINIIKDNPLGYGVRTAQRELHNHYPKEGHFGAVSQKTKLDAHNTFFQITIETGLIGLFLLLWSFYVLFTLKTKNLRLYKICLFFTITFMFFSLIESSVNRYMGISFFSFFSCLFIYLEKLEMPKNKIS